MNCFRLKPSLLLYIKKKREVKVNKLIHVLQQQKNHSGINIDNWNYYNALQF